MKSSNKLNKKLDIIYILKKINEIKYLKQIILT